VAFVKLDCGILRSSLWFDRDAREVFITALLMAEPHELKEPLQQIEVRSLELTGWSVPAGWYGLVAAAGVGIIRQAGMDREEGYSALERLGKPEADSRSHDFEGRRLVRVDGGYIVLNFIRYREKDVSGADRQRRWRDRQRNALRLDGDALRDGLETQAEAEAEAEVKQKTDSASSDALSVLNYWQERTKTKIRSSKAHQQILTRIKARLRDGCSVDDLKACVDFALVNPFYVEKGYAKNPHVIWRNAERVQDLATRWSEALAPGGFSTIHRHGPTPEELAALDAESDR
jgi:hypothetical protein